MQCAIYTRIGWAHTYAIVDQSHWNVLYEQTYESLPGDGDGDGDGDEDGDGDGWE